MTLGIQDSRDDLIAKLEQLIDQKLPINEAKLIKLFLAQYYLSVSPYELREKSLEELYGALISEWHFIYQRKPGESKVRAYNPQFEEHGWQSLHTIIEISHENKPFLLDSVRLALNKLDINVRLIIHAEGVCFERDTHGKIINVLSSNLNEQSTAVQRHLFVEAPIYIEIDRQSDTIKLQEITDKITAVLRDVDLMVRDWGKMLAKLQETIIELEVTCTANHQSQTEEAVKFLRWLAADHFTFIGYAEYSFTKDHAKKESMQFVPNSALGVLSGSKSITLSRELDKMYPEAQAAILSKDELLLGKTDTMSTVHRPAYTDFIGIKFFDADGNLSKMVRFIGLYTAIVYTEPVDSIPFIRQKVTKVFELAAFSMQSYDGKALLHILDTLPRDELLQARDAELFEFAISVLHLQERQKIKLLMRRDVYGRYFSCLIYVPKELFNAQLRNKMQDILMLALNGKSVTFDTKVSESILARIHFIIRVDKLQHIKFNCDLLEEQLIAAAQTWDDDLHAALMEHYGEEKANALFKMYANTFPSSYREIFSAQAAIIDIEHIERLRAQKKDDLEMSLYRPIEDPANSVRFKLFRYSKSIPLSDVIPILEKMGLKILSERSHEIDFKEQDPIWITDYSMVHPKGEVLYPEVIKHVFQEAFAAIWSGQAESDCFNRLILNAKLNWRDISILRAYYRYLWQIGSTFSQAYVEDALYNNSNLTLQLIAYFYVKFDPNVQDAGRAEKLAELKKSILKGLDAVVVLNEDRIIRCYLGLLEATVRVNFFQHNDDSSNKNYIAFKLDSSKVPDLPLPKPVCEIFVYSTIVEAIHLRGDKIARGGIRWSDRHDDFRTEVLGLMKAQQVKNAVIVPLGAKGGFVVKTNLLLIHNIEEKNKIAINAYKIFMHGLLDLTDNYHGQTIVKPIDTVCWDADDPYLVVAADKGTATFSDIANEVAKAYNFWLGDAFASGGRTGYDHKKMAITARGAWESVKLHFTLLGVDPQTQPITVIGIGDMAGDVFGNGMLQSTQIRLLAAFNHVHIFVDPNPDVAISFAERKRLFTLPTSTWKDYNPKLISPGGGVFERSAKKIPLSPEMQKMLNTKASDMEPNVLIKAILTLNVDLFFNGGIGTFVKATSESNSDVGDRINDLIRVNGNQLRATVVCEGGNLGFTQLGRIEYAKNGGIINTDAIDNSGGVNCSDVEVNIKILLNELVEAGDLTEKQRNELLVSMTDEVAQLVLANNRKQNCALILTTYQSSENLQMHYRLLQELVRDAGLDPVVEYLPDSEEISLRLTKKQGFTCPEIAVLMAYTKIKLKKQLLLSNLLDEAYVEKDLIYYFPRPLQGAKYINYIKKHRLKNAIIATRISNYIVNEMGINFVQRLMEESGADSAAVAKAYMIAREVFEVKQILQKTWLLEPHVAVNVRLQIWQDLNRLIRRATRWFIRNVAANVDINTAIKKYKPHVAEIRNNLEQILQGAWLEECKKQHEYLMTQGLNNAFAYEVAAFYPMFTALDIVEATIENNFDIHEVAKVYFAIGSQLELGWFGELIKKQPVNSYWDALARAAFRDDVDTQQRNLAVNILQTIPANNVSLDARIATWLGENSVLINRWKFFIKEFKTEKLEFTMFAVALRALLELANGVN